MLGVIEESVRERPDRAVVVVTGTSPNGFMRRIFEAGAEDVVVADEIGEPSLDLRFAVEKAVARRQGSSAREIKHDAGEMICVLGPEGRHRQDADRAQPRASRSPRPASASSLVDLDLQFGDVGLALGPQPGADDLRPRELRWLARRREGRRTYLTSTRRACGCCSRRAARPGRRVTVEFLRELYALLRDDATISSSSTRRPGSRPEVIAAIDASSRVCMVGDARRAVAQEHEARRSRRSSSWGTTATASAWSSTAPTPRSASRSTTSSRSLGRAPDVLVPSHRDITRSVNEASRSCRAAALRGAQGLPLARRRLRRPTQRPRRRAPRQRRGAACGCTEAGLMELHERLRRSRSPTGGSPPTRSPSSRTASTRR